MTDRRGSRFVFEILFLIALATTLTLAHLDPLEIAGVMLLGWVIVAALEWAAWRGEPHYGSGLPPRYYVPPLNLPPAQPLEQVAAGYPDATRDEAPTWIAPAALRAEVLGEWPVAAPVVSEEPEPEAEPEPEVEVVPLPPPVPDEEELVPLPPVAAEPEPDTAEDAAEPEAAPAVPPEPTIDVVLARSAQGVARYSLDPLGDPPPKRRFGRGGGEEPPAVEVPARPAGVRALPGRTNRQD